jgi:hypothetical protein
MAALLSPMILTSSVSGNLRRVARFWSRLSRSIRCTRFIDVSPISSATGLSVGIRVKLPARVLQAVWWRRSDPGDYVPRQWRRAASLTSVFAELTWLIKSYINFCTIAVFGSPCDISGIRRYPPLGRNARGTVWSCSGNFSLFQAKMTVRQERRHPKL